MARPWLIAALACSALLAAACDGSGRDEAGREFEIDEVGFVTSGWKTDFAKHSVPLSEFASGGPPRDGIPPIDRPKPTSQTEADEWISDREPVLAVEVGREVRAYPLQIMVWHEIVNDTLGGRPIAVTYCPLCNSSLVLDRRVRGRTLTFGTTGNLRNSDLVMWDRQTESWWQQLSAEAVVGELTGTAGTSTRRWRGSPSPPRTDTGARPRSRRIPRRLRRTRDAEDPRAAPGGVTCAAGPSVRARGSAAGARYPI
jgi:hypothetical protein